MRRLRHTCLRVILLALMVLGLTPMTGSRLVVAQEASNEFGAVSAVALDASGNGWAWGTSPPQTFFNGFLLRIEGGTWRVATSSEGNRDVIPVGAEATKIVLTSKGDFGWAIGDIRDPETDEFSPLLMRLRTGTWAPARHSFPATMRLLDITIAPDESDGWMTAYDDGQERFRLLRFRNGSWDYVALPANGGALEAVALSPDGKQGWAAGPRSSTTDPLGTLGAYRLNNGQWQVVDGDFSGAPIAASSIVADNSGNGWMIGRLLFDIGMRTEEVTYAARVANQVQFTPRDLLVRLSRNSEPRVVDLDMQQPGPVNADDPDFTLRGLTIDAAGRGWLAASYYLGTREDPPVSEELYAPGLYRLQGDTATLVPVAQAGYKGEANFSPLVVASSREGAHTWLVGSDGYGFGRLGEIREPWSHERPAAANPLSGAGLCWVEVAYCMRGVFAQYWQRGGLTLFGYPITPEVQENISGKVYTVQYTQRARFEYHPEFRGTPNEVLLGLLGNTLVESRLSEGPFQPKQASNAPGSQYFAQTQHNVASPFIEYWRANGGLPVYGLPRSEAFEEKSATDGKVYTVQYFERNRFEYHPENRGTKFEMLLGLLGTEQFQKTYGYTP
ncbi:MAG: hypothetical protein M3441_08080 [Chloroflexota bacterium]|nr:hypothetical protein [Chloroflexota bacterium]